jgi:hypothetical protein
LGTPAFSIARSRFVLIEGTRERRERERFATLLESDVADRFIEADGCTEVLARLAALRLLASEEEQLRVAGIVDRDFRSQADRERLHAQDGVHVLSAHEVENLFLQPQLVERLLADAGRDPGEVLALLQHAADPDVGRWAFEKTKTEENWREDARAPRTAAASLCWRDVAADLNNAAGLIAASIPDIAGAEVARRRLAVREHSSPTAASATTPKRYPLNASERRRCLASPNASGFRTRAPSKLARPCSGKPVTYLDPRRQPRYVPTSTAYRCCAANAEGRDQRPHKAPGALTRR